MQGFCFALLQCSPTQAFTAVFISSMQLYRPRYKTAHRALQALFLLFAIFYTYYPAAHSTMLCSLRHAGGHTGRCNASSAYQIPPPRRAPYKSAQPHYYNKVYKGAPLLWIHARQCNISQTMPARRGQLLPFADRWQVLHPAHLLRKSAFPPIQGQPGGGLDASHAWH